MELLPQLKTKRHKDCSLHSWDYFHCWSRLHFLGQLPSLGHLDFWARLYFFGYLQFFGCLLFRTIPILGVVFIIAVFFILVLFSILEVVSIFMDNWKSPIPGDNLDTPTHRNNLWIHLWSVQPWKEITTCLCKAGNLFV